MVLQGLLRACREQCFFGAVVFSTHVRLYGCEQVLSVQVNHGAVVAYRGLRILLG
jgi:hypothetical protein